MRRRFLLLPAILAALAATGADWTQFRGPGGLGLSSETGLPATWSSTENIVWRTKLPGPGTSSPIVVGQRIYLTSYTGYGLQWKKGSDDKEDMNKLMRHLVCIDRAGGKILWTKDFKPALPESKYEGGNNTQHGYASSTVASDGQRLYVFFGKSGVYCLDLDGKEIWRQDVGTGTNGWGSSNSPVLYKDLVLINASIESGTLFGLDKNDGTIRWRAKGIRRSWNTPVLVKTAKGVELVVNESKAVIGFDPEGGEELWRVTGFDNYVCPSVVTDSPYSQTGAGRTDPKNAMVYVVRDGALAIQAGGRGDVTESHVAWRTKGRSLVPSPVYHDGRVFWPAAMCLDAATGMEVYRGGLNAGTFYASPLVADGRIYNVSRFDGIVVIDAGPKFKKLAHNKFADDNSRTNASPIAHDGQLLLRTDLYLYCIGKK
ncbi:MAG: PQQ-binding-like beta-propeller repeat protein [Gemmataceae bacterium]|nr:PQQ-binding-like beta-propeller repeat protein [Gemmataceae bacterium]